MNKGNPKKNNETVPDTAQKNIDDIVNYFLNADHMSDSDKERIIVMANHISKLNVSDF